MDSRNKSIEELEKTLKSVVEAFRQRMAARGRPGLNIPRVFANVNDDTDLDDAPDALVGARLRPTRPLGGLAIALTEPDEEAATMAVGVRQRR